MSRASLLGFAIACLLTACSSGTAAVDGDAGATKATSPSDPTGASASSSGGSGGGSSSGTGSSSSSSGASTSSSSSSGASSASSASSSSGSTTHAGILCQSHKLTTNMTTCSCTPFPVENSESCDDSVPEGRGVCCAGSGYPSSGVCSCSTWACTREDDRCWCRINDSTPGDPSSCSPLAGETCCQTTYDNETQCTCSKYACTAPSIKVTRCDVPANVCGKLQKQRTDCR